MKFEEIRRKFKYALYIPRGITNKPKKVGAAISDLFCIRNNGGWETYFELINVPALIMGNYDVPNSGIELNFFDENGIHLKALELRYKSSRQTINICQLIKEHNLQSAKTFAIFHKNTNLALSADSFLAERGYVGYKRISDPIRGYVHGNLDSVAKMGKHIAAIGNLGVLKREYRVQHVLRGPANYEFFLINPTRKKVKVEFGCVSKFENRIEIKNIKSRGISQFNYSAKQGEDIYIYIKSKLYLGRPLVFRVLENSFDVFHG